MATPKVKIELEASGGLNELKKVGEELDSIRQKAKSAAKEMDGVSSSFSKTSSSGGSRNAAKESFSGTSLKATGSGAEKLREEIEKIHRGGFFEKLAKSLKHLVNEFNAGRAEARAAVAGAVVLKGVSTMFSKRSNQTSEQAESPEIPIGPNGVVTHHDLFNSQNFRARFPNSNWYDENYSRKAYDKGNLGKASFGNHTLKATGEDAEKLRKAIADVHSSGFFTKFSKWLKHIKDEFNAGRAEARKEYAAKQASETAAAGTTATGKSSGGTGMTMAKEATQAVKSSTPGNLESFKKASEHVEKLGIKSAAAKLKLVSLKAAGVAAGTAISASMAGALAVMVKFFSRMNEARNYRQSMVELTNEQKRLEMQTVALGYVTDAQRDRWLDYQIQIDKLAWSNRYLTEADISAETGIKNLGIAFGTVTGTITDFIGTFASELFPSLEDLESFLNDYIAPAIASCVTVFTNFGDVVEFVSAGIEVSIGKISDTSNYVFTEYIPSVIEYFSQHAPEILVEFGKNVLTLFENIGKNIFAALQSIGDFIYSLLPKSFQDTFSDIQTMWDNFLHNCGEFAGAIVKYFQDIPSKMGTIGHNFIQFFKNLWEEIGKMFMNFIKTIDPRNIWKLIKGSEGALKIGDIAKNIDINGLTSNGMKDDTTGGFGEYANYVDIRSGTATEEEREKRKKEREEKRWKFTGLGEGMSFSAWGDFKAPEQSSSTDTSEAEARMNAAQERMNAGYKVNLDATQKFIRKNLHKESEARGDKQIQPFSPAEMIKALEGSTKASTEGLTSAYDRINNAVSNRNPMVEILRQQMATQKQVAAEQKQVAQKQNEATKENVRSTDSLNSTVVKIYDYLTQRGPAAAAVVEG